MDAIDALMTTRSMRRYTDAAIGDDEILVCLRAAQQAPSGGNIQPQHYVVVTEPETKAKLGDWYLKAYDRYEQVLTDPPSFRSHEDAASWERSKASSRHLAEHIGEAPVIVLFLLPQIPWSPRDAEGEMDIGPLYASIYPAVQNFMVAARALGIGTALTTVIRIHTNEVRRIVEFPNHYEIAALVPMGRPVGRFGVARRKPAEAVTHWNRWGNKRT